MKRHLVLLGLPGAGKTTVGRRAAVTLGAAFEDTDDLVTAETGRSVADIFARDGEAEFRRLERLAMAAALDRPPRVIAAGGGWAAQPGNLEVAAGRAFTVFLSCAPETAARRTAGTGHRPLLGHDPLAAITALLDRRVSFYQRADAEISTDSLGPDEVASRLVALARSQGGW